MEEIIYFKDENVILTDSFFKYGDIKYSLNVINKTEVLFYPYSKLKLYFIVIIGFALMILSAGFGISGRYFIIGFVLAAYVIYFLIMKKFVLNITLSTNKTTRTLISKDLKYLKEIDDAFQLAFNDYIKNQEQK